MKSFHVIHIIPSPYRLHLFNEMWRQLLEVGVEFHVHFMSDMSRGHDERPLPWRNPKIDFPHTYWKDYGHGCHHYNPGMLRHLRKLKPDYLFIGSPFDTFTGIFATQGFKSSIKCAGAEGNTKTTGKMGGIRGWIKRQAFSGCKFIAVPGSDAVKYVALHQALTRKKMPTPIYLPNLIDETRFKPREEFPAEMIASIRKQLNVGDKKLCIIPARLEWYKGLKEFFAAASNIPAIHNWRIVIMGQGSLNDEIQALIRGLKLDQVVSIVTFVPYAEMPAYYAASDLFLLPSLMDRNPLTVVEAVHSGLPIALSCMAGNVEEGVTEGKNGWVLPVKDEAQYIEKLKTIFSTDVATLREMGQHSLKENAQFWDTKKAVRNFLAGLGIN